MDVGSLVQIVALPYEATPHIGEIGKIIAIDQERETIRGRKFKVYVARLDDWFYFSEGELVMHTNLEYEIV